MIYHRTNCVKDSFSTKFRNVKYAVKIDCLSLLIANAYIVIINYSELQLTWYLTDVWGWNGEDSNAYWNGAQIVMNAPMIKCSHVKQTEKIIKWGDPKRKHLALNWLFLRIYCHSHLQRFQIFTVGTNHRSPLLYISISSQRDVNLHDDSNKQKSLPIYSVLLHISRTILNNSETLWRRFISQFGHV